MITPSPPGAEPLIATPHAALLICRASRLLRAICPREVQSSLAPSRYVLVDGCANAPHLTITSRRCTLPAWSYEVLAPLPGSRDATQHLTAWDGREWFEPSYASLEPPPYLVHVLIQAASGTEPPGLAGLSSIEHSPASDANDVLLNPRRTRAVSLGWVRWYGHHGELILEPTGGQNGGEVAGHLIFGFAAGDEDYAITLHAWAPKIRLSSHGRSHTINAPQPGPALPHVIATLKAIVGSTLTR